MSPATTGPFCAETEFYRALNALVEPAVRAGLGSPGLVPSGLVVLETTGARTGLPRSVTVLATVIEGCVFVSTLRGPRSRWIGNLVAEPRVRYWLLGREHRGRARVFAPEGAAPGLDGLPPMTRGIAAGLLPPAIALGWTFAIIVPD
jgi:F420H(2)-dependent quinone reductase